MNDLDLEKSEEDAVVSELDAAANEQVEPKITFIVDEQKADLHFVSTGIATENLLYLVAFKKVKLATLDNMRIIAVKVISKHNRVERDEVLIGYAKVLEKTFL